MLHISGHLEFHGHSAPAYTITSVASEGSFYVNNFILYLGAMNLNYEETNAYAITIFVRETGSVNNVSKSYQLPVTLLSRR